MSVRRRSKRKPGPRQRRPPAFRVSRTKSPTTTFPDPPSVAAFQGPLWNALRQGARNIAGVRYQLAVTALLLAESKRRVLPFVELVPEGFEDIDCLDGDSTRWLVQVKEFGAGAGTLTASSIADVISHAASAPFAPSRIVAITDGQLGTQLAESGWGRAISETPGYDVHSTIAALTQRGYSNAHANILVRSTHLVRYPWNILPLLTDSIARCYALKPAVATLIAYRLVDAVGQVAADQRHTAGSSVGRYRRTDLDALVQRTMTVVDVRELDSAVRLGICDVADYTSQPGSDEARFLQGIDAIPAHIGSGFDVVRPEPCRAVQRAIESARYALIAGPSGAGKSTQVWRSARDVARAVQVIRVHRVETGTDVTELVRHVRLLEPSDTHAVVVCCDDLGRPRTSAWPLAARHLLALPGVVLLGAVRQEDFTAELLRHGGVLVELHLDDDEATAIAHQLAHAGMDLQLEIPEAVRLADGQLMEFVSLLTTGRRLQSVLADQVESLVRAGDQSAIRVARLVCASHIIGVELDAAYLGDAVNHADESALTQALVRLQDEHIVTTEDQSAWRGLHQRRSEVLTELLHKTPPPTRAATLADVLSILRPGALGWGLRRVAELFGEQIAPQPDVVAPAVSKCSDARELATLIEGLERADHSWSARSYIPAIERHRRKGVPLLSWALMVCAKKLAGIDFGSDSHGPLGQLGRRVQECASDLPSRSTIYSDSATSAVGNGRLLAYLVRAPLDDAVRLLEAVTLYVRLSKEELTQIAAALEWPRGIQTERCRLLYGRLLDGCHCGAIAPGVFVDVFGPLQERLARACRAHPNVTSMLVSDDGTCATIGLLGDPREGDDAPRLPWDSDTSRDQDDPVNRRAVELATYIGECCPELEVVEVRTVIADGSPLRIRTGATLWEPGHKRLGRDARRRRSEVRVNVGIRGAIARQVAAYSWTELVRARERLAAKAGRLVGAAGRRLSAHDNQRRRREWHASVREMIGELAELPAPPVDRNWEADRAAASWDVAGSEDTLTDAVRNITTALDALVARPPERLEHRRLAAQVGTALKQLRAAHGDASALRTSREAELCEGLVADLERLRGLLAAISHDVGIIHRIKAPPGEFAARIDEVVGRSAVARIRLERQALEDVFANVEGVFLQDLPDEVLWPSSIGGHRWIVGVPAAGWEQAVSASTGVERSVVGVPVTLVCIVDDVVLPVALGVPWTGDGFSPVAPEEVAGIAAELGRRAVPAGSGRFFSDVLDDLVLASWKAARMRLRPAAWAFEESPTAQDHLERARQRIGEAVLETEFGAVLRRLCERVAEEMRGGELWPVAAAVAVPRLLDAGGAEGDDVTELVETGTLFAIAEELRSCVQLAESEEGGRGGTDSMEGSSGGSA